MENTEDTQEQLQVPEIEQVEYNLSSFKIMHIARLIEQADMFYLRGLVTKAFFHWKCVFLHIKSRLSPSEISYAHMLRVRFYKWRDKITLQQRKAIQSYYYEKYESHLQNMLKKYGFDMKEKEQQEHLV